MYVAYTAAHWPMHALDKDIAKYKGKVDDGYEPVRRARVERLKRLGLIDAKWDVAPTVGEWDSVKNNKREARCKEVFNAMVDNMDQGIGRVVAELRKQNCLENTVAFLAYGRNWANVSNTPFREYKHWVHEGGISTPLIVHWPKGIAPARRGKLETQPGHLVDIMATCVGLSGANYPKELNGHQIKPMEGVSLEPAFKGDLLLRTNPIFWEHESNRAVREGNWKLVAKADQPWELYDMEKDRTEMHDLASQSLGKVKDLAAKWDAWAARANVLPLGGWKEPSGSK